MKICSETFALLKNFASINSNVVIKPGSVLTTMAPSRSIVAQGQVAETFANEIGIWDLNKFLATASLFKDPDFDFREKFVRISGTNGSTIDFFYADVSLLTKTPNKFNMPEAEVSFQLDTKILSEIQKASAVLEVPDLSVEGRTEGIFLKTHDKRDPTCNVYSLRVGDNPANLDFVANFKIENLKLLPGMYNVKISSKNVSEFHNTANDVKFWISLEADSRWN